VEGQHLQSLTAAFGCRARRTLLLLFVFAVGLFAVSNFGLLQGQRMRAALELKSHAEQPSILYLWLGGTTVFALFCLAMACVALRSLRRWFERHVARPLNRLTVFTPAIENRPSLPSAEWRETTQITSLLMELIGRLNENDARTYRLQRDAAHRLRECEADYGRELRRVRERATTDPLTGVRNRAFLEAHGPSLFDRHKELGHPLAVIMMDVDDFKAYNDAHGHQAGDALLRFLGALLRGSVRPEVHAVRYGGDEFLLLMPGASASAAQAICQRLIKLFAQYTPCVQAHQGLSLSAGVAALPDDSCTDIWQLIARADRGLYHAKSGGKNNVAIAGPSAVESNQPPSGAAVKDRSSSARPGRTSEPLQDRTFLPLKNLAPGS
jgi:diguanylate cyclase (GGDEF)-like protein